jgi:hypothetical protein
MSDRPARPLPAPNSPSRRARLVERLEPRMLMAGDTTPSFSIADFTSGQGLICGCPVCRGMLDNIPEQASTTSGAAAAGTVKSPLSSLPILHSNNGARVKIYLDFNGNFEAQWGQWRNASTPVFDQDGDRTTFSDMELATIREIWARVSEDYSSFNVDVTTQDPGSFANGQAIRVCIGGNYSDWFGQSAGGVAYVGAFTNSAPNVAYVFSDALGHGNARYVAEAASHEAGHTFGLTHQSSYSGTTKTAEYNRGNSAWAPIMGVGYYSQRTTWHNGQTTSSTTYQDDMAILASQNNGFGFRADDYGNTMATAGAFSLTGTSFNVYGTLATNGDIDAFRFTTSGGTATINLGVAQFGNNLDGVLELRDANGNLIVMASPGDSFGASLSRTLSAGTYYVMVHSSEGYGNVGQYTVSGTIAGAAQATPEIFVALGGSEVVDGGSIGFGSTLSGAPIDRTFTVTNTGSGTLNLTPLNAANLPTGFSIVSNIGSTSLASGQSTTFTIRFLASAAGVYSGRISLLNSDANEGSYDLNVSATATAPVVSPNIRVIDDGAAGFSTTGGWGTQAGLGREGDQRSAAVATNTGNLASANWNFTNTQAGSYRVAVTWSGMNFNNASNAPFAIYDGNRLVALVRVSQRGAAAGFNDGGSAWVNLGTYNFTSNSIRVVLLNSANGRVVADAVRIERMAGGASNSLFSRSLALEENEDADQAFVDNAAVELAAAFTPENGAANDTFAPPTASGTTGGGPAGGSGQSLLLNLAGPATPHGVPPVFVQELFATDPHDNLAGFVSANPHASDSSFDAVFSEDAEETLLPQT